MKSFLSDFDFGDIVESEQQQKKITDTSDTFKSKAKIFLEEIISNDCKVKKQSYQIIENALTDIRVPESKEQLRIRTQQQLNMISIVLCIIYKHKNIDELSIVTYTLNRESFDIIEELLKSGKIKKINLYLASSYSFRDAPYYEFLKYKCVKLNKKYNIHLVFAWLHLKVTLARCKDNYYHVEGSMNYSQNNMAEQIVFENDKNIYDFDYDFMNKYLNRKNKALEIVC